MIATVKSINKSNKLMALLSVWGILLVVLGHSGFEEPIIASNLSVLHNWIYSFHMPLFFFISGYLFTLTNRDFTRIEAARFLRKKALRLLVPYVVLGTVIFAVKFAFSGLSHTERTFSITNFLIMFVAPHATDSTIGYLWYVITLFVIFAVVVLISKCKIDLRNDITAIAVIITCWGLNSIVKNVIWLNISADLWYLPFFVLGVLFNKHEASMKRPDVGCGIISLLPIICFPYVKIEAPLLVFGSRILMAVAGIIFSVSLCNILLKSTFIRHRILPCGDRTYTIYLLSWFGQYSAKVVIVNAFRLHWIIVVIGMFICGISVPLLIRMITEKAPALRNCKPLRLTIGS